MFKTFTKTCLIAMVAMLFAGCQIHQTIIQEDGMDQAVKSENKTNTSSKKNLGNNPHLANSNKKCTSYKRVHENC